MIPRIITAAAFLLLPTLPVMADVDIREVTSEGGIKAWLVEAPEIPFIALEIGFKGGATQDPPGKEGAVSLMTALLEEGTGDLDAQAFAAARDMLAAGYSFGSGTETVSISARFLSENRDQAIDLLRRAINEPAFPDEAIARVRAQMLANLEAEARDPDTLAGEAFERLAFGEHPYARPEDGTLETVAALTREDLQQAHRDALARDRLHVAAVGDITAEELGPMLDRLLGALPEKGGALPGPAPVLLEGQVVVQQFPGPQSVILFGQPGIPFEDPEYLAANMAAEILGGSRFGTRLMTEVREKRGLTYGIGAGLVSHDQADLVMGQVQTANATAGQTIDVIRQEWARIPEITADELEATRTWMTGSWPLRWDSNAKIARQLAGMQMQGYPIDYPRTRNERIDALTLEQVQAAARRVFDPASLSFVVVGQPEGVTPEKPEQE